MQRKRAAFKESLYPLVFRTITILRSAQFQNVADHKTYESPAVLSVGYICPPVFVKLVVLHHVWNSFLGVYFASQAAVLRLSYKYKISNHHFYVPCIASTSETRIIRIAWFRRPPAGAHHCNSCASCSGPQLPLTQFLRIFSRFEGHVFFFKTVQLFIPYP